MTSVVSIPNVNPKPQILNPKLQALAAAQHRQEQMVRGLAETYGRLMAMGDPTQWFLVGNKGICHKGII